MKKLQVGILVPWVNVAMEEEIPSLLNQEIGVHWSRLRPSKLPDDGHDSSYLELLLSDVPNALSKFDGLDLDAIVLGCTSASFSCPFKWENYYSPQSSPTEMLSAFDTVTIQLRKLGSRKLMLFAPYEASILTKEVSALEQAGFGVIKAIQLGYDKEIRFISPSQICETFAKTYTGGCDAIFFSCTALYTLEAIDIIRQTCDPGIPLLSSNTAIANTLNDLYYDKATFQIGKRGE